MTHITHEFIVATKAEEREQCCLDMCQYCRGDYPPAERTANNPWLWHRTSDIDYVCIASPIRNRAREEDEG